MGRITREQGFDLIDIMMVQQQSLSQRSRGGAGSSLPMLVCTRQLRAACCVLLFESVRFDSIDSIDR